MNDSSKRSVIIDGILPSTSPLLDFAEAQRGLFRPSGITIDSVIPSFSIDPNYRSNFLRHPRIRELASPILGALESEKAKFYSHFEMRIKKWREIRTSLTVMENGHSIAPHIDFHPISGPNLQFIFLFYFCELPKRFTGGELVLRWGDQTEVIAPQDNRLVVFPRDIMHSVAEVRTPDSDFRSCRFALIGRILAPPTVVMQGSRALHKLYRMWRSYSGRRTLTSSSGIS